MVFERRLGSDKSRLLDPAHARRLRANLISDIAARHELHDTRVLEALRAVPRHLFTPEVALDAAYGNFPLPIGKDQTISQPAMVAIMTDSLELSGRERVLEIGTGSGYQSAILSMLASEVYSIELHETLAKAAKSRLSALGYDNVVVRIGDGYKGWPDAAPFDRVLLTAAPPDLPSILLDELAEDGILVAPIGSEHAGQVLYRVRKHNGNVEREDLGDVRFVPMVHPGLV